MLKYNAGTLQKIEALLKDLQHVVRYEKGNFQSGYCLVKHKKVVIVNKFYTTEARIYAFLDLLKELEVDTSGLDEAQQSFYAELIEAAEKRAN
jgi:hypothetical protein